jgi:hypothetical protein
MLPYFTSRFYLLQRPSTPRICGLRLHRAIFLGVGYESAGLWLWFCSAILSVWGLKV